MVRLMSQTSFQIVRSRSNDYEVILRMLKDSGLTIEGIDDSEFWIARNAENGAMGIVGLEIGKIRVCCARSLLTKSVEERESVAHLFCTASNKFEKETSKNCTC
jgi:hypothetical protein